MRCREPVELGDDLIEDGDRANSLLQVRIVELLRLIVMLGRGPARSVDVDGERREVREPR
jgi:hypothetical protein